MKYTKEKIKQFFLFNKVTKTLLENENIMLVAEMDCFNNHIAYLIEDKFSDIVYETGFDINEAIDKFYEIAEK